MYKWFFSIVVYAKECFENWEGKACWRTTEGNRWWTLGLGPAANKTKGVSHCTRFFCDV